MTAGQVIFSIIAWGFLLVAGWEYAVWEVRQYQASKRKRYKQLLREIDDLERELGVGR
jgi:hypothetical protein